MESLDDKAFLYLFQLLKYKGMKPFLSKLDMMSLKKLWRKLGHYNL